MAKTIPQSTCPSAQPDMRDALVFGIINGTPTAPRVAYLRRDAVVPLADLPDLRGLEPGHVFRIAATCEQSGCVHFESSQCALARRIAAQLQPVVDTLPPCQIRAGCRWYAEQGAAICYRCPQVMTFATEDQPELTAAAMPAR
jgi:hypothetical protein